MEGTYAGFTLHSGLSPDGEYSAKEAFWLILVYAAFCYWGRWRQEKEERLRYLEHINLTLTLTLTLIGTS